LGFSPRLFFFLIKKKDSQLGKSRLRKVSKA
jgi:hypothetical protein